MSMKISRKDIEGAVQKGLLSHDQAEKLWSFWTVRNLETPGFHLTHILYYLGGLIAIGAMTLFMTLGWEHFGGWGILGIALIYATIGLWLLHLFLRRGLTIPAGIMGAFVVALTPLAIYGLQHGLDFWIGGPYRDYHRLIDWNWLLLELGTLASGLILLWRYRLPFMVMPVAATLLYLSMDLTPFLFQEITHTFELRKLVSLYFGLLMSLVAFWVDVRSRREKDYAFWLYLFGVAAFWGGLSLMDSDSELSKFTYMCVNVMMILVGAMLSRRVFAVFGGLGVALYLGHLANVVFKDSVLFPFVLSLIGLAVVGAGVLWQKNEQRISQRLRAFLPAGVRAMLQS